MRKETITLKNIESFKTELIEEEKSTATINKYIREILSTEELKDISKKNLEDIISIINEMVD